MPRPNRAKTSLTEMKINDFKMMDKYGGSAVAKPKLTAEQQQQHQEPLPCPRCHSANTKFCYYNNYNFSQPRHFCKSCRRYWTRGGTLREVPIGGGSRKSAKRYRTVSSYTSATSSTMATPSSSSSSHAFLNSAPVFLLPPAAHGGGCGGAGGGIGGGGFTSLFTGNHGPGVWALGSGFGLGSGPVDDTGFGLVKSGWTFCGGRNGSDAVVEGGGGGTWQIESDGFGAGGDCFGWPELAISTQGKGLK